MATRPRDDEASGSTKQPTNVLLEAKLVAAAKELGVNVSQACERGLREQISEARNKAWVVESWEAIQGWNKYVEINGLPLAHLRQF